MQAHLDIRPRPRFLWTGPLLTWGCCGDVFPPRANRGTECHFSSSLAGMRLQEPRDISQRLVPGTLVPTTCPLTSLPTSNALPALSRGGSDQSCSGKAPDAASDTIGIQGAVIPRRGVRGRCPAH